MEKGSCSSAASGPGDSLNGLKFGKKIYFEDVGGGGSSSKFMTAAANTARTATGKRGKGVAQAGVQQKPARCQVEGCNLDLTGAKAYYCRHKVCGVHSKSPKVVVAGLEQRFCQQCSRFHLLSEFDQGKRSCRRRLAGHNERRRKPPPGPLTPRYGWLSSFHGAAFIVSSMYFPFFQCILFYDMPFFFAEDNCRYKSYLTDFTYSRQPGSARDIIWPTMKSSEPAANNQWQGKFDTHLGIVTNNPYPALFSADLAHGDCLAGVSDSSCALSLLSTTQPWGAAAVAAAPPRNQGAPLFSVSTDFDTGPMAELNMASGYMSSPWAYKDHASGSSGSSLEMGLRQMPDVGNDHFSSELHLALQGNRLCPDELGGRELYDHDHHAMHWSL